jgi:hypothetical protein
VVPYAVDLNVFVGVDGVCFDGADAGADVGGFDSNDFVVVVVEFFVDFVEVIA